MAILRAMTTTGPVEGIPSGIPEITVFKGVPYAAAPVGDLRWRAPQPHASWQETRLAAAFGPAAIQSPHPEGSFYQKEFYHVPQKTSEDCLYLNIWTGAEQAGSELPVMVWYHGGAYMHGWGHEMEFDGEAMAKRGVVLVTVNYRVGALGYLAHKDLRDANGSSGNYGLLDQIFALSWVRDNIRAFGGDPNNVTIFGQSAGGGSVQALCASPMASGLFLRAIIMSAGSPLGGLSSSMSRERAEMVGDAFVRVSGKSLEELQRADAEDIRLWGIKTMEEMQGLVFVPNVDGVVLPEPAAQAFYKGTIHARDIMLGSVTGDAELFAGKADAPDAVATAATLELGEHAMRRGFQAPYIYHFAVDLPGEDHPGAFHSSELWYVFGTLMRSHRPFDGRDFDLSRQMTDLWTEFARTGDPGHGFTAYTAEHPSVLWIDSNGLRMEDMREHEARKICLKRMRELNDADI